MKPHTETSKIIDISETGVVLLEDGYVFTAKVNKNGPYLSGMGLCIYLEIGQSVEHQIVGTIDDLA